MDEQTKKICPDCEGLTRREFLKGAGLAVAAGAGMASLPAARCYAVPKAAPVTSTAAKPIAESVVKSFYDSLTPGQREKIVFPWSHPNRTHVDANWAIVKETVEEFFTRDQQAMITEIFQGITSEEFHPKFVKQMQDDSGGIGSYHVAVFGDPDSQRFEWVMTGRHSTIRAAGHSVPNRAFGGPIFYGHAVTFNEKPDHPGNIFWYQARRANQVFHALDGKQRDQALIAAAPPENQIHLRGTSDRLPGIPMTALSRDQQELVHEVMHDILAPFRPSDVQEVMRELKASGGFEKLQISFYKQDDLGNDGVWDIWRLEGPAFVWHFRGAPHVHTWVNIAASPDASA